MKTIVALIFLLVGVHAVMNAKPCQYDSQCEANECCQKLRKHPIMSRREVVERKPGHCAALVQEGGDCEYFRILNGYCGCAPDLNCKFFPQKQAARIVKRKRSPGNYMCVKN